MEDRSFFTEEGRHGTDRRPMAVLRCRSGPGTAMPARYLAPRHWHEEVEILYFTQGRFTVEQDLQENAVCPGGDLPGQRRHAAPGPKRARRVGTSGAAV